MYIFTHIVSLSLSLSLTHTHTHTQSQTHARTHTHTHTHTQVDTEVREHAEAIAQTANLMAPLVGGGAGNVDGEEDVMGCGLPTLDVAVLAVAGVLR